MSDPQEFCARCKHKVEWQGPMVGIPSCSRLKHTNMVTGGTRHPECGSVRGDSKKCPNGFALKEETP